MSEEIENPEQVLEELVRRDGRYPLEAFAFLHEGLARAVKGVHGAEEETGEKSKPRHVGGRQLCLALRDEAIERWGLLARTVLTRWGIRSTMDFGNMVFLLVDHGLMQKTDQDAIEDFRDAFDFEKAFGSEDLFQAGS